MHLNNAVVIVKFQILINAIRGIQNMVLATKMVDNQHLGSILAALKVCVLIVMATISSSQD